jgi:hypothetical protein
MPKWFIIFYLRLIVALGATDDFSEVSAVICSEASAKDYSEVFAVDL